MPVALPERSDLLSYHGPCMSWHAHFHSENWTKNCGANAACLPWQVVQVPLAADACAGQCQSAAETGLRIPAAAAPEQVRFHRWQVACCASCELMIHMELSFAGHEQLLKLLTSLPEAWPTDGLTRHRRCGTARLTRRAVCSTPEFVELEVPPALGNGAGNAGLPLARLLWHLPARAMVALLEALLLERRVLLVAQDKDTVSAAVHCAAALLYPFSWQHIYLPLLPLALKVTDSWSVLQADTSRINSRPCLVSSAPSFRPADRGWHGDVGCVGSCRDHSWPVSPRAGRVCYHGYEVCFCPPQDYLAAPMPFLMGLHAPDLFMPTLRSGSLEEVVMVDLDRGAIHTGPGQPLAQCALPWADQLRDAFDLLKQTLRSPLEHESTPHIIGLMQEYFVKLLGRYPSFIERDAEGGALAHSNGARLAEDGANMMR